MLCYATKSQPDAARPHWIYAYIPPVAKNPDNLHTSHAVTFIWLQNPINISKKQKADCKWQIHAHCPSAVDIWRGKQK